MKKIQEGEARMGENMCLKWVAILKAKDIYQNKACNQSHYV